MRRKIIRLNQLLKEKLKVLSGISLGVFLFVLFFQPFSVDRFDFNNRLLFVAGFGVIFFIIMFLVRIVFPWIIEKSDQNWKDPDPTSYLSSFIILVLCSVAFVFYLRYVGFESVSFYMVFKVVLICLIFTAALRLFDVNRELLRQNESLVSERKIIQKQIEKYEEANLNKSIEFISDTGTDNFELLISDVILIQSADNYVEILFMDSAGIKKKLIRNTLKNIEIQIKQYSNFIRCHRTCIVNMHYIEKLNHDYSSHWLTIRGYNEKIPVSRQYLLKLREAL